jgi:hypothetical protein
MRALQKLSILIIAAVVAGTTTRTCDSAENGRTPNIVVIMADDK